MTLNIKDPEAHKLARKLADHTGETMTRAVTEALRERLARVSRAHRPRNCGGGTSCHWTPLRSYVKGKANGPRIFTL